MSAMLPGAANPDAFEVALRAIRPMRRRQSAEPTPGRRFAIPFDHMLLPAWSAGDGPTVLLVHGWEGSHRDMGALAQALAAAGYRAVTIDFPGHGEARGQIAHVPMFADAIQAAARALGPLHAIVAHSIGGVAAALALSRRGWLHRAPLARNVVLIGTPSRYDRLVRRIAAHAGLDEHGIDEVIRHLETLVEDYAHTDAAALARRLGDVRSLLVYSPDDRVVPIGEGERLAAAWPDARLERLDGLGHKRILFAEDAHARIVRFLPSADQSAERAAA
jgi:pimeloyl-ACP methyl ester carboxylesterase